jgi:RND family efflux transporter MFP subunit
MSSRLVPLLLLSSCVFSACRDTPSAAASRADDARAVRVATVTRAPVARTIVVTGTLAAEEQVVLSLKVTGRLQELLVDLGSPVRRGQVIGRLSPTDFELRVQQAEAALQQARARLGLPPAGSDDTVDPESTALVRQARAVLDEARLAQQRVATFVQRGISARADLETADSALQVAEGRYQDAREEVQTRIALLAQRRSELALARQQLEDSVLKSPIDGIVRERQAMPGEYRAAGTPIVTVVRQHPLRLQVAVPERVAADVQRGQAVRITIEGDPAVYEGRVVRLSPAITEGNRTLPIEAEVPNPEGRLRPGSFARAEIVTSEDTSLVVPAEAVVTFAGVDKVLTVRDGRARELRVRTGRRVGNRVEILDGLSAGIPVIVEPGNLADGAPVRPQAP